MAHTGGPQDCADISAAGRVESPGDVCAELSLAMFIPWEETAPMCPASDT